MESSDKQLHIAVTYDIGAANFERIKSVGPNITVHDISALLVAEHKGDITARQKVNDVLAGVEVLYARPRRIPSDIRSRMPRLAWIQLTSAGADTLSEAGVFQSRAIVTNVRGMHAVTISEFVLQLMLMFVKDAPRCFRLKQARKWDSFFTGSLESKTVGIVGLGSIGHEIARLSKAFSMRVIATRRSVKAAGKARYVDLLLPADQLPVLLRESDFVVLVVPFTPETNQLIKERELGLMKKDAYLINVARGSVVDEAALIRALENNRIAGAGLDVFEQEPLPVTSKLWDLPNVILSSHLAGGMENYFTKTTEIFCENLERYLSGRRLKNIVSKKKGY